MVLRLFVFVECEMHSEQPPDGPDLYLESFRISLNSGSAMSAKSFNVSSEEIAHPNPTKDQMVLISVGGLASLIAFSLFFPGFIPSGVRVNPR